MFSAPIAALAASLGAVALLTWPGRALAGDRLPECGGPGQCSCNIAQVVPSCDAWSHEAGTSCGILDLQRVCVTVACGGADQRPCVPFVDHRYSDRCRPGLYSGDQLCQTLDGDGYPSHCGGESEPACVLTLTVSLGISPCKSSLYDDNFPAIGNCRRLGADGYPPSCGHHGQVPCGPQLIGSLAAQGRVITPCAPGVVLKGDGCVEIGADSDVPRCGGRGEPACTLDQQLARLTQACEAGLDELYPPLGSCFPREDLTRPPPQAWPVVELPAGRRSVFLIHGMTGSADSFSASPNALAGALKARGHRVFNVDYHADRDTSDGLRLYELIDGNWRLLGVYGRPLAGTTLSIGDVAANLREAILATRSGSDIALVGHSMGGLVARTLVQKHYDELRRAGKRIADVITLGSPHTGGGFGIPDISTGRGAQGIAMCWGLRAIRDPRLRRVSYQACMMGRWHEEREQLPPGQDLDNRDFPQIRWVTVAGGGQLILNRSINLAYREIQRWLNEHLGLDLQGSIAEVDSDSLVAVSSAFGIQVDACFPHSHQTPDARLSPLIPDSETGEARLRRTTRWVRGQPLHSAECFLASPTCRASGPCPYPSRLDATDHLYENRQDVVAFVVATLASAREGPHGRGRSSERRR